MNILLTGGASGLGEAITKKLAGDAANTVHITYARSEEKAKALESEFPNLRAHRCDFKNSADIDQLQKTMASIELHALINNALTGFQVNHFHKLPASHFAESFNENIVPVIRITQQALKQFQKAKSGRIITILSMYVAGNPPKGLSEYVAAKNYLLSLNKSWAVENARYNITANCISPSFMQTPINAGIDERVVEDIVSKHPLKKLLQPEEVADTVAFLLSGSAHINGINLLINAGENVI